MKRKHMLLIIGGLVVVLLLIAVTRVALLKRSVGVYKEYWATETARASAGAAFEYVALGDSAAQGVGATSPRRGYVGLVAEILQTKAIEDVQVRNISVSGAKLQDVIDVQLPKLAELPYDVVTIEAGANDIPTYNEAEFTKQFQIILESLPAGAYVSNMPSFNNGRMERFNKNAVAANKVIARLIAETDPAKNLHAVDLYSATEKQTIFQYAADLFHPNNSGYKNWAKAFQQSFETTIPQFKNT